MFYDRPLTAQNGLSLIVFLKLKKPSEFERKLEPAVTDLGSEGTVSMI
jgi:hypothetical protein